MNEKEREFWMNQRRGLLMQVDAIERFLDMASTKEAVGWAKSHGWPPRRPANYNYSYDVDVTEAQPE